MPTKKDIKWLHKICKEYNIKCYLFDEDAGWGGFAEPWNGKIMVAARTKGDFFKSIVLHELAHCLNYRNKKYYLYHINPKDKRRTLKYLRRNALRAEVYTELQAKKLARKHGVKKYWRFYYFNKKCRQAVKEYYGW